MWSRARALAERTPATRNRYVDFLRAASITVVVLGHWLVAAPHVPEGSALVLGDMLSESPWTQWLTWALQVMPIFFIVGGFANGLSWAAAKRDDKSYSEWIGARLRRLVGPLVPLILIWSVLAVVGRAAGVAPEAVRIGSQAALIPTWFLAVYIMVAIAVPVTHWLFQRMGSLSFGLFAAGAVMMDVGAFRLGLSGLRWANYAFIWLGVHQLGYLWQAGRSGGAKNAGWWLAAGLGALVALVGVAGYPVSMITVPGEAVSNSRPPTLAMFALGISQFGLVSSLEAPFRRWLNRPAPWTATVLVNGTIMTIYLWHLTAMVVVIGVAHVLGDVGLRLTPGTASWWMARPIWLLVYGLVLAMVVPLMGRFEQTARKGTSASVPAWRAVGGALGVCIGVALLALGGIGSTGPLGVQLVPVTAVLGGAGLILARAP